MNDKKHSFVDSANAFNFNFSDTGLFGLSITGCANHATDVLNLVISEFRHLRENVSKDEFERAKNVLKYHIFTAMER